MTKQLHKIDFHTHSIVSHDGGITKNDYHDVLQRGVLDQIAITDHHTISLALELHQQFGEKIIVGEEITTLQGHLIGLFLRSPLPKGEDITLSIEKIKEQDGIVYIPHPFDSFRHGIGGEVLEKIYKQVDVVEGFNGRVMFPMYNQRALLFAKEKNMSFATGSDAHTKGALGSSYTMTHEEVTRENMLSLLQNAEYKKRYQNALYYFSPKINTLKKYFYEKNTVSA